MCRIHLDKPEEIEIPEEFLKRLEAIEDTTHNTRGRKYEPWEDAAILKYWPIKNKKELAKEFGVTDDTLRKRYKELINGKNRSDGRPGDKGIA